MLRKMLMGIAMGMAVGCGSSTEPQFPGGTFMLVAVNGVAAEAPFDASSCANVYETGSFLNVQSGDVSAHFRTHPNCRSDESVYDDAGSAKIDGSAITIKLNRQSVSFTGTVSADQSTITLDMRDIWNPDTPATARFTFVR